MDNHTTHHESDHVDEAAVCYRVGIIFVAILALLILLGILN